MLTVKRNLTFSSFGAVCSFVSTAAWIAYVAALPAVTGAAAAGDIVERYRALERVRFALGVVSWGGLWGALLAIPAVFAFYRAFRKEDDLLRVPLIASLIGLSFLTLSHTAIRLTLLYYFAPAVLEARSEALPILIKIGDALSWVLSQLEFVGSFLAYGLGVGLFGLLTLRQKGIPRPVSVLGIVCGAFGLLWLAGYFPFELPAWLAIIPYANIAAALIWYVAMAVILLKADNKAPA